jgi:tetratricopeptide (TPR) repeat protein
VRKWVRRHRAVAALLVTLSVTVLAFAVVAGTLAVRLARQRQAALAARDREATARATAEEISSFVQGILAAARPERAGGREVTARELLDQAAESLSSGPAPRPEVEAAVRNTIGHSYYKLGEYGPAAEHMTRVLELFRQTGPAEAVGQRLNDLGNIYRAQGRLDEALELYQEALQLSRAAHAEDKHLAFMLQNLASIRMAISRASSRC